MRLRAPQTLLAVALAVFLAGCASGSGGSGSFARTQDDTEFKVFVTNLAFSDVTLYGITNGGRRRLGRLTGKKETVLSIPLRAPSPFQMEIDFLAGPTCFTETMVVDPGDHVELIIQNDYASMMDCRRD